MTIELVNDPCTCPEGVCMEFVEPPADCINRLTGDVRTMHCEACDSGGGRTYTWHQDGVCLSCKKHGR